GTAAAPRSKSTTPRGQETPNSGGGEHRRTSDKNPPLCSPKIATFIVSCLPRLLQRVTR
ncbi:unnamed protein product, partial [Ectocarpus sp. 12 AP-2014]